MPGFARFNQRWAVNGIAIEPTIAQSDAGFAYLGQVPPSVELFNSLEQWKDEKDNWLFNQIDEVILYGLGVNAVDLVPTQLRDAIEANLQSVVANYLPLIGGTLAGPGNLLVSGTFTGAGPANFGSTVLLSINAAQPLEAVTLQQLNATAALYVLKTGDSMSGSLGMNGVGVAVNYSPPTSLVYGIWSQNGIGFGWDGANVRVRIDDIDVGTIPMNMSPGLYVLKSGDTMTGALTNNAARFNSHGNANNPCINLYDAASGAAAMWYNAGLRFGSSDAWNPIGEWFSHNGGGMINQGSFVTTTTMQAYGNSYSANHYSDTGTVRGAYIHALGGSLQVDANGQINGNLNTNGSNTMTWLQVNGSGTVTGNLNVGGTFTAWTLTGNGGVTSGGNTNTAGTTFTGALHSYGNIQCDTTLGVTATGSFGQYIALSTGVAPEHIGFVGGNHEWMTEATGALTSLAFQPGPCLWVFTQRGGLQASRLEGNGNYVIAAEGYKPGGGTWANTSSRHIKRNIENYTVGLDTLCELNPVSYKYNDRIKALNNDQTYIGLVAEDVESIMPEMVHTVKTYDDDYPETLGMNTTALIYAAINAFKEIRNRLIAGGL